MVARRTRGVPEAGKKEVEELGPLLKEMDKRYGVGVVKKGTDIPQPERIPTDVFMLDFCLLGGIPVSRGTMLVGHKHSGKGGRASDHVLTPQGWVQYSELRVGDFVIGSSGKPTKVTGVFPRGVLPTYRVSFTDGASVIVDGDHLWAVQTKKQSRGRKGSRYVLSTEDLFTCDLREQGGYRYRVPLVAPVQYVSSPSLLIDPYLLGVLLANGHLKRPTFTTNDVGVVSEVRRRAGQDFVITEHAPGSARRWWVANGRFSGRDNVLLSRLGILGLVGLLSADKFIPEEYLLAQVADRLSLLQGLMDCDGSVSSTKAGTRHHKGGAQYCTRSLLLAQGVQALVRSLGGTASVRSTVDPDDGKEDYSVGLVLPVGVSPFLAAARKVETYYSRGHRGPVRSIVAIQPDAPAEVICISVEAEDSLYVTEDYVVTHNTTIACKIAASAQRVIPDGRVAVVDIEGTLDTVWAEKHGVVLEDLIVVHPESGEAAVDIVDALLRTREVSMVIVDSVAALAPMKEMEGSAEDAHVGLQARLMGGLLRKATAGMIAERRRGHFVTPVYINQYRSKIGGFAKFGEPLSVPGGKALGFANSVEIVIKNHENSGKNAQGIEVVSFNEHAFKIEKNKLNGGSRVGEFRMVREFDAETGLGEGAIDDAGTMLTFAKKYGAYEGGGSSWVLHFWDEEHRFRGAADAVGSIYQDGALYQKLRDYLIWENAKSLNMPSDFLSRFTEPHGWEGE